MQPYAKFWECEERILTWQPISVAPKRIKKGQPFLARWKDAMDEWQVVVAYYGQFGDCFVAPPFGYFVVSEGPESTDKVTPEEWCDIPA